MLERSGWTRLDMKVGWNTLEVLGSNLHGSNLHSSTLLVARIPRGMRPLLKAPRS
jgi:hypothetical protein